MNSTNRLNRDTLESDAVIELDDSELAQVAGGVKPHGTAGGNVAAGWNLVQGRAAAA